MYRFLYRFIATTARLAVRSRGLHEQAAAIAHERLGVANRRLSSQFRCETARTGRFGLAPVVSIEDHPSPMIRRLVELFLALRPA